MKDKSIGLNVILNVIKKCVNIIIPLIIYPYVSRVLGTQSYGRYAFAESIIGYISLISGLGISTYAIREVAKIRNDKYKVAQFSSEIFTINLITTIFSLVILWILVICSTKINEVKDILKIMAAEVMFNTLSRDWLNEAYEDYMYITLRYIFFQILSVILIIFFVKTSDDAAIYALFRSIAIVGGYIVSIFYTQKYASLRLAFLQSIKKHWKPLLIWGGCSCASVIYIHSDITLLGFFTTNSDVGIYAMVSKIYTLIKSFINAAVLVMIPRASYYIGIQQEKRFSIMFFNMKKILVIIVIPVVVLLWCLSNDFILILAGTEYIRGSVSLKILAISLIFAVFSYLLAYGCLIPNSLDRYFLIASIASATFNIIANIIFIPLFGMNAAAITTLLSEVIMYLITNYYSKKICANEKQNQIRTLIISIIGGFVIYLESILIKLFFYNSFMRVFLLFIGGGLSYLLILYFNTTPNKK